MLGNWIKTFVLMAAITALFGSVGAAFGGYNGCLLYTSDAADEYQRV